MVIVLGELKLLTMKKYLLLFLLTMGFNGFSTEKDPVETTIKSVTVYRERATVNRSGKVFLKSGENTLILTNLSPDIDENSIQIAGLDKASVRSILYRIDFLEKKTPTQEIAGLEALKEKIDRQIKVINNTADGFREELKILGKNQIIHGDQNNISVERVQQMTAYYRTRTVELKNELLTLEYKTDSLNSQVSDINKQIRELSSEKTERRGLIEFIIDAPESGSIELEVSYTVATAGWYPTYDIRAKNTTDPVEITYKANVYQQTGTDWDKVQLTLSTGDPTTNNTKPKLSPRYLNFGTRRSNTSAIENSAVKYNPMIRKVTGNVVDDTGLPLPGVNIIEQNTSNGTQTDFDGNYTIAIQGSRNLEFSYVGFESIVKPIYGSQIDVQMLPGAELDEVVVVAQGIQRESKALGYAVSTVESEDIARVLSGKASGVQITRGSGIAGNYSNIRIRGNNSINASSDALYIIDGVPVTGSDVGQFDYLDSDNIADIEILKGAAASNLYGSDGRNGVIVITTKSGQGLTAVGNAKFAGLTTTRFEIQKEHTINSNAKITAIDLDKFNLKAEFTYYAAPALNENVFLTAKINNWEALDMLQGEANIYFDGNFAGKTQINPNVATNGIQVSLGPDPAIVIQRKEKQNFKSKSFLGGNRVLDRTYEILIKNNKPIALELLVEDRVPVSQNKEIKVEDIEHDGGKFTKETGIIQWKLNIPAKGTSEKTFSFVVKHPKYKQINL